MYSPAAELLAVLEEIGVAASFVEERGQAGEPAHDLVLAGHLFVEVKSAARPTLSQLRRLGVGQTTRGPDFTSVLVADYLDIETKEALVAASWGWLERSGHLFLVVGKYHIDREVKPLLGPDPIARDPLTRETGLAVALELLALGSGRLESGAEVSVREIANASQVSVGSAHRAMTELAQLGLLREDGRARPSLFWAVSARWAVRWFPLLEQPMASQTETLGRLLQFGFDDLTGPGWAETGDGAAGQYGAPIGSEGPPRFYVPDRRALTWALRTSGEAADARSAAALVAVPPTQAAVRWRRSGAAWPLVRPLVAALELASSGPRGREALTQWTDRPPEVPDEW